MNLIKKEKNIISRKIAESNPGLSKQKLLELSEAVKYFSNQLQTSRERLGFEEKRKILRMLIQEIHIGKDEITINHIIPIKQEGYNLEIARLRPDCARGWTIESLPVL